MSSSHAKERQFERRGRVLVVDDEAAICAALSHALRKFGHEVDIASDGKEALLKVANAGPWDVAICDVCMPGIDGMEFLARALEIDPRIRVVMMTGYASIDTAVTAIKLGAADYLTKPFDDIFEVCRAVIGDAVEHSVRARTGMVPALPSEDAHDVDMFEGMVGTTLGMRRLFGMLDEVSYSDASVLIQGETGVGKELVAAAVHRRSQRASGPFLPLNCAALPGELLESELFGHRRGAFTGADRDKVGIFEAASGGTIFLDEIAEMPLGLQAKLLRVLEAGEIRRVGDHKPRKIDVRVVAATHRDLKGWASQGQFRQDLFYRLAVVQLAVPTLHERTSDIVPLVSHFLTMRRSRTGHALVGVSDSALEALKRHDWPGNVRELRNVVERAVIFAHGPLIELEDLPDEISRRVQASPMDCASPDLDRPGATTNFRDAKQAVVDRFEVHYVRNLLENTGGNISAAARIAGLDRSNFRRLLKRTVE